MPLPEGKLDQIRRRKSRSQIVFRTSAAGDGKGLTPHRVNTGRFSTETQGVDEADNQGGQEETDSNRRNKDDQHRNKRRDRYKDRRLKKGREGGGGGWETTLGRRKPQWEGVWGYLASRWSWGDTYRYLLRSLVVGG